MTERRLEPVDQVARTRHSSAAARASARESGLAELNAAAAAMSVVRASLNMLEPACSLPMDLLAYLFVWVKRLAADKWRHRPYSGWIILSQVCQPWRKAALDCSALWNQIEPTLSTEWADIFIARSRASPLSVRVKNIYNTETAEKTITHLIETAPSRVQAIELEVPAAGTLTSLLSFVFARSALLSSLVTLNIKPFKAYELLKLPNSTSSGPFSSLSSLSLPDLIVNVPWSLIPSSLTSVTVTNSGYSMSGASANEFSSGLHGLLSRLTQLEVLSLCFEGLLTWSKSTNKKPLLFPKLRALYLSGAADKCSSVLGSLASSVKGLQRLGFKVSGENWESLFVTSFLPAIHDIARISSDPFARLSITGDIGSVYATTLCIHAHRTSEFDGDVNSDSSTQPPPSLSVCFVTQKPVPKDVAKDLLIKLLPSDYIPLLESLHVSVKGLANIGWTARDWLDHFRTAQVVRHLHAGEDCSSLIFALGSSTQSRAVEPPNQTQHTVDEPEPESVTSASEMLFPLLQSLVFQNVDFSGRPTYEQGSSLTTMRVPVHQIFMRALAVRLAYSGVPRSIKTERCKLAPEQAEGWAMTVPARLRDWTADSLKGKRFYY